MTDLFSSPQQQQSAQYQPRLLCSYHGQVLTSFCLEQTCKYRLRTACRACLLSEFHRGHQLTSISEFQERASANAWHAKQQLHRQVLEQDLLSFVAARIVEVKAKLLAELQQLQQHLSAQVQEFATVEGFEQLKVLGMVDDVQRGNLPNDRDLQEFAHLLYRQRESGFDVKALFQFRLHEHSAVSELLYQNIERNTQHLFNEIEFAFKEMRAVVSGQAEQYQHPQRAESPSRKQQLQTRVEGQQLQ